MNIHDLDESLRNENPCWKGYHPVGTKKKNGKTVPNCVPNATEDVAEGSESSIQKKIQAKQDSLSLAREQRRAKGQRQQGQREIKLQAEIDRLNTELTQLKRQGVAEDQLDEAKIASSEDEDFFHKGKKVGSITKITLKDGMVYYRASAGNSHISGSDTRQEALRDLKELLRREKQQGVAEELGTISLKFADGTSRLIRTGGTSDNPVKNVLQYLIRGKEFDQLKRLISVDGKDVRSIVSRLFPGNTISLEGKLNEDIDQEFQNFKMHVRHKYPGSKDDVEAFMRYVFHEFQHESMVDDSQSSKIERMEADLQAIMRTVKKISQEHASISRAVPQESIEEDSRIESDTAFKPAGDYKNYPLYVRKTPFVKHSTNEKFYIAVTQIGKDEFKTKGRTPEAALQAVKQQIDQVLNAAPKVSGGATLDFNVKFANSILNDPRTPFYAKVERIGGEPKLVIAGDDMLDFGRELMQLGFKPSALRVGQDSDTTTPLPSISYSKNQIVATGLISNGRYEIGNMSTDRDGNRIFDLKYHSTAHTKSDKQRLPFPAFTVGSNRAFEGTGDSDTKIAGRHSPTDFDDMVRRVGQRAKQGPLKTVFDPVKRVYKNVPAKDVKNG